MQNSPLTAFSNNKMHLWPVNELPRSKKSPSFYFFCSPLCSKMCAKIQSRKWALCDVTNITRYLTGTSPRLVKKKHKLGVDSSW